MLPSSWVRRGVPCSSRGPPPRGVRAAGSRSPPPRSVRPPPIDAQRHRGGCHHDALPPSPHGGATTPRRPRRGACGGAVCGHPDPLGCLCRDADARARGARHRLDDGWPELRNDRDVVGAQCAGGQLAGRAADRQLGIRGTFVGGWCWRRRGAPGYEPCLLGGWIVLCPRAELFGHAGIGLSLQEGSSVSGLAG